MPVKRFNESGPDVEALPYMASLALSLTWMDLIPRVDRFGFSTWEIMEFRAALFNSGEGYQ